VVQGSVLGPILFLIYINSLDAAIQSHDMNILVSKYADDTKIGREITDAGDSASLQQAIDNLKVWCEEWGMEIHPDKCLVIHFGRTNPRFDYHIAGKRVKDESSARDLGIIVEENCSSSEHVKSIAKKAHATLSQIKWATTLRDSDTFTKLYTTYCRPLLESAAPAWNPSKREDVETLEKVQHRALRMISDLGDL